MSQHGSNYRISLQNGTRCPECECKVHLLADKELHKNKPMFFVCYTPHCGFVAEVGKGEVLKLVDHA